MTATATPGASIYDVLANLRDQSTDERNKGSMFEDLVARFLVTEPRYANRFESVVTWSEYAGQGDRKDLGIDLVGYEHDGGIVAIQCKFYAEHARIEKHHIDSFFTASGKAPFTSRLIVSTTDNWGPNAEEALSDQQIPVSRIGLAELNDSRIEWEFLQNLGAAAPLTISPPKQLREHQRAAIDDVLTGFGRSDRGKLIMACGTGKTFTSLKLVEEMVKPGGSVLFMVPSISLLSQSLREWGSERAVPMRFLAVCSDTHVGRTRKAKEWHEDISTHDLEIPATTSAAQLLAGARAVQPDHITVVFSTYQSIDVIAAAQKAGLPGFELIICDEAHRTTGATLSDENESNFVKIHKNESVAGTKRLYMTATPRVYGDDAKKKAAEGAAVLTSMDDEKDFGPVFHRLAFGAAVDRGLLADYKVLILNVSEDAVARTFQASLSGDGSELSLPEIAKLVGCWNAMTKRQMAADLGDDTEPMRRAVAFAPTIKASKQVAAAFASIGEMMNRVTETGTNLICEADHVDGTQNALHRNERLAWLKAEDVKDGTCRILSNARCLSEGVDVPALDAVLFLNPRNSIVDVVQSVGRVMRVSPGKKFGYVIIPVAVPAGMAPDEALDKTDRYKVVWDVLRALRSHDERLEATVNTLSAKRPAGATIVSMNWPSGSDLDSPDKVPGIEVQHMLDLGDTATWTDAIFARLVKKVGQRMYWDTWGKDVATIADAHVTRINALLDAPGTGVGLEFDTFLAGLQGSLNPSISRADAVGMLAQHLVTRPVFRALFDNYDFTSHNAVAQVMEGMLAKLDEHNLDTENKQLENFYESVRLRLKNVDDAGRLRFVNELYEKFFKLAFPKVASQLGIVYTPVEIVDFIIRSVEHVLNTEFDASLSDTGVHVLDPFTGTGTFIVRLLQSGLIKKEDLLYKYTHELHCNEILLLAYYIAAINIEATFHGIHGGDYVPFTGAVLADTFQSEEEGDTLDERVFTSNNERMQHQRALDIRVIIGNPPYSVGQDSQNDGAANLKYPTLDKAIETTYAARSSATNKNSLYDSYIRAIRWASDRIKDDGVIGFVTNGSFIDGNTGDGLRKTLADEFSEVYVYNLRGNARTAGEQRRMEGGNIFAEGARTAAAITVLVKRANRAGANRIHYRDIGDCLTAAEKLAIVKSSELDLIDWLSLEPNDSGDWLNQRDTQFEAFTSVGSKDGRERAIFGMYSGGVKTNRDAWAYNSSRRALESTARRMVDFYNSQVAEFMKRGDVSNGTRVEDLIDLDPRKFSWNRGDKAQLTRGRRYVVRDEAFRVAAYRPFSKQRVLFDRDLNDMVYRMPAMFPAARCANFGIDLTSAGSQRDFAVIATDCVPDLHLQQTGQFFPRYTYVENKADDLFAAASDEKYTRVDNITDEALSDYRAKYGAQVSKDDIFYYVYGLLHSSDYRTAYAADLKRMLPRIPMVASAGDFRAFADAGRQLADLHIGYEAVEPWPLEITGEPASSISGDALYEWYRVEKMRFGGTGREKDRSTVVYNSRITVRGVPDEAYEYVLGSRSGVEWVMERYQMKVDKASQIKNDPNDWSREVEDPRYILDLLGRVVRVSVETVHIVAGLPALALGATS